MSKLLPLVSHGLLLVYSSLIFRELDMWHSLQRLVAPQHFYRWSEPWIRRSGCLALGCFAYGLYGALWLAPADYQQGDGFRIIYVHVPSAFMSLGVYLLMATCSIITLVWKIKLADIIAGVSARLGAIFTFLALITGAIWGKPMWGTWWVWDARLTSELILLFLYAGYLLFRTSIGEKSIAAQSSAILAVVGLVNIPIIHYSVQWWNTLHQGASLQLLAKPTIDYSMLVPLLVMIAAFIFYFITLLLSQTRYEILKRESKSRWVQEVVL